MSQSFVMAESYFSRSANALEEAREQAKKANYPESISASQMSMEFSMKAIFLYFDESYPKSHELKDEDLTRVLKKVPEELNYVNLPRLLMLTQFWSSFYIIAKYGYEKSMVGPEKLFNQGESQLAIKHAEECNSGAFQIKAWRMGHLS